MREIPGVTETGKPAPNVTKKLTKRERDRIMNLAAVRCPPVQTAIRFSSTDSQIRAFLDGETDGEELLHAIYDHVLDEPMPERLRAILKR